MNAKLLRCSWPVGICCLALLLLSACAARPLQTSERQREWLLAGAGSLQPADSTATLPDPDSLLALTDAMRAFAHAAVQGKRGTTPRLRALADALHAEDGLALRYDAEATLTAREAFEQRRANCLGYTLLFVALAREVGIDARFNDVDVPPIWDLRGDDAFVLYRHVNARIDVTGDVYAIVDVTGGEYDRSFPQRIISDRQAQAHYFNNRAVELRLEGRMQEALRYHLRALQLDAGQSYLWANLGHFYLKQGHVEAAHAAVNTALELDPRNSGAYGTATYVYEALGDAQQARHYRRRAEYFLHQNPYYHYQLAVAALQHDDTQLAYRETRRALALHPQEHRFFYLMGVVLLRLEQPQLAQKSFQAAIDLSGDEAQKSRYRSKLSRLPGLAKEAS